MKTVSVPADGDTVVAETVTGWVDSLRENVNGGIEISDVDNANSWAEAKHFVPPNTFGGALPRALLSTADWYWQRVSSDVVENFVIYEDLNGEVPVGVHGCVVESVFDPPFSQDSTDAVVFGGYYALEVGGQLGTALANLETNECATFALNVDGIDYPSTQRRLYASTSDELLYARKRHVFFHRLYGNSRGRRPVGLFCTPKAATSAREWVRTMVNARTMWVRINSN